MKGSFFIYCVDQHDEIFSILITADSKNGMSRKMSGTLCNKRFINRILNAKYILIISADQSLPCLPDDARLLFIKNMGINGLSDKEMLVMENFVKGLSVRKMAEKLYKSEHTIKSHCYHINKKLGVHSISAALRKLNGQ